MYVSSHGYRTVTEWLHHISHTFVYKYNGYTVTQLLSNLRFPYNVVTVVTVVTVEEKVF